MCTPLAEKILIAYATRSGTTAEIAEAIGQTLVEAGIEADVAPVAEVRDLSMYAGVIVGSPIYGGSWREEALAFVEAHELDLMELPVAYFTVGMLPVHDMRGAVGEHWGSVQNARLRAPGVDPMDYAMFTGAYDPEKFDFVSRKVMEQQNSAVGDFRDWEAIAAWARKAGAAILARSTAAA